MNKKTQKLLSKAQIFDYRLAMMDHQRYRQQNGYNQYWRMCVKVFSNKCNLCVTMEFNYYLILKSFFLQNPHFFHFPLPRPRFFPFPPPLPRSPLVKMRSIGTTSLFIGAWYPAHFVSTSFSFNDNVILS